MKKKTTTTGMSQKEQEQQNVGEQKSVVGGFHNQMSAVYHIKTRLNTAQHISLF